MGLVELGNKDELDQVGLKLWLNWSLEDFSGWWGGGGRGGGEKLGINLKLSFSWGLGLAELGNICYLDIRLFIQKRSAKIKPRHLGCSVFLQKDCNCRTKKAIKYKSMFV